MLRLQPAQKLALCERHIDSQHAITAGQVYTPSQAK